MDSMQSCDKLSTAHDSITGWTTFGNNNSHTSHKVTPKHFNWAKGILAKHLHFNFVCPNDIIPTALLNKPYFSSFLTVLSRI